MGLFDFLSRRRARESALGAGIHVGLERDSDDGQAGAAMQAFGASQVLNLQGQAEELRQDILETLKQHGIDAAKGDQVNITDGALQQEIFEKLAQHGLDVGSLANIDAAAFGAGMGAADAAATGLPDTVTLLERLQALREQGALSQEEFERQKRDILGG